ncbi:hypothetical protein [Streptomyces sp. NPDC008150]|uniref:hypothetical protein n=1 Tax=Streptomyces sp. NPDC008150 TaxID=3364816 RepID=UPI0036EB0CEF
MRAALLAVGAVLALLMLAGGVAGVVAEWVPPWARSRVLRPRLAGAGWLVGAVGWTMWTFGSLLSGPGTSFSTVQAVGWVILMAGLVVQFLGTRPGRVPAPE